MSNKGQMFLITATIIIVILVLLRTSINLPDILQREKEVKSRFEKEFFLNIVDELVKVIDISYHQSNNITNNVFDFANFTRKKMTERILGFEFLYVGALANVTSQQINVTLVNLLNKPINATLDLNGTSDNQNNIEDASSWATNFTFSPGSDYVLTVSYNVSASTFSDTFTDTSKIESYDNLTVTAGEVKLEKE
jgi:hypothetical protein